MNSNHYLDAFRRSWAVLVVLILLGGLVGLGLSLVAKPLYTATSQLYFAPSAGTSATDLNQGSTYTQAQMLSFAQLATSPVVLDSVIRNEKLGVSAKSLAASITATTPQNTVVLEVAVTQPTPQQAAIVANAVASSLATEVEDLTPTTTGGRKAIKVTIVSPATEPSTPSSPDTSRNLLAGVLIGLVVGVLIVFLRYRLDTRVRNAAILAQVTDAPLLGSIEQHGKNTSRPVADDSRAPLAESFRQLGAHLASTGNGPSKMSLLVTSSTHAEGSSEVAVGLAAALSERGRRVLLVDANLRHPHIAALADLDGGAGLGTVLDENADSGSLVQTWDRHGFDVLPAGPAIANSSVLLSSPALSALMKKLKSRYEVIIVDVAPVAVAADAAILGALVDGALVVADSRTVREAQLAGALNSLEKSKVTVLGIVLNRVHPASGRGAPERPVGAPQALVKPKTAASAEASAEESDGISASNGAS
jgi:capsular exopolysaccharide synthesis family protein